MIVKVGIQPANTKDFTFSRRRCVDFQDVVSPEETGESHTENPDAEFEGMGDYEESFLAEWWQEPKTKWDTGEIAD